MTGSRSASREPFLLVVAYIAFYVGATALVGLVLGLVLAATALLALHIGTWVTFIRASVLEPYIMRTLHVQLRHATRRDVSRSNRADAMNRRAFLTRTLAVPALACAAPLQTSAGADLRRLGASTACVAGYSLMDAIAEIQRRNPLNLMNPVNLIGPMRPPPSR